MTVLYDPQIVQSLVQACQVANDELIQAQSLIQAVRSHEDWGCKEKDAIDDLMGQCKSMVNQLCEQQSSFLNAVTIVEGELKEAEGKISGLFSGVDNVIAGILAIPAAVAVTNGGGLIQGIGNIIGNVQNGIGTIIGGVGGAIGSGIGSTGNDSGILSEKELEERLERLREKEKQGIPLNKQEIFMLGHNGMNLIEYQLYNQNKTPDLVGEIETFVESLGTGFIGGAYLQDIYQQGKDAVNNVLDSWNPFENTGFDEIWKTIKDSNGGVANAWEKINGISSPADALRDAFEEITSETVRRDITEIFDEIKDKAELSSLLENVTGYHDHYTADIPDLDYGEPQIYIPPSLMDVFQNDGLIGTAVEIGQTAVSSVTDLWGEAVEIGRSVVDSAQAYKVVEGIATPIVGGIDGITTPIVDSIGGFAAPISGAVADITDLFENIPVTFADIFDFAKSTAHEIVS